MADPHLMIFVHPIVNVTIFSGLGNNHGKILFIATLCFAGTGDFYITVQRLAAPKWRYKVSRVNIMQPIPNNS